MPMLIHIVGLKVPGQAGGVVFLGVWGEILPHLHGFTTYIIIWSRLKLFRKCL